MRINNNLMAMNTHRQLGMAQSGGAKSMEKLSSGFRINRAGDDAAGLAISEKMRGQIRGLNQASRNAQDSISLIQTAEGALNETHNILQRMRELAVQSASDTNVEVDREEIQKEMNQLTSEINRIGNTTEFNTMTLLDGSRVDASNELQRNFADGSQRIQNADTNLDLRLNQTGLALAEGEYEVNVEAMDGLRASGSMKVQAPGVNFSNVTGDENPSFQGDEINVSTSTWSEAQFLFDDVEGASYTVGTSGINGNTNLVDVGSGEAGTYSFSIEVAFNSGSAQTITYSTELDTGDTVDLDAVITGFNQYAEENEIAVRFDMSGTNLVTTVQNAGSNFGTNTSIESVSNFDVTGNSGAIEADAASVTAGIEDTTSGNTDATSGSMGEGVEFTLELNADGNLLVSNASSSDNTTVDIIEANSDGHFVYDNHGISFTITDVGDWDTGDEITFQIDESNFPSGGGSTFTQDITALQQGWVVSRDELKNASGVDAIPEFLGDGFNYDNTVGAGNWVVHFEEGVGLHVSFYEDGAALPSGSAAPDSGDTGIIYHDVIAGERGDIFEYDAHGVEFRLNSTNMADDARAVFEFDEPELDGMRVSVEGVGNAIVLADEDGNFVMDGNTSIRGLTLNSEGLEEGSFTINVAEEAYGENDTMNMQIGANQAQALNVDIEDMRAAAINVSAENGGDTMVTLNDGTEIQAWFTEVRNVTDGTDATAEEYALDVSSFERAGAAVTVVNNAIESVSAERSKLGALQNRLEHTIANLDNSAENLQAAESRIRDVDMAQEMMEFTKQNILQQASTAMLAQANMAPQSVLQLLG